MKLCYELLVSSAVILCTSAAIGAEVVSFGGFGATDAVLERPARPRGSVVLLPGGDGYIGVTSDAGVARRGNTLVRIRGRFASLGLATLTVDSGVNVAEAIQYMQKIARPVVVVGMSRGSQKILGALSAAPDGVVLMSAFLSEVQSSIGSPSSMPPALVLHHRHDGCHLTPPDAVAPFKAWGGARTRVVWADGGRDGGDPCGSGGHHGFAGVEGVAVSSISQFVSSLRR